MIASNLQRKLGNSSLGEEIVHLRQFTSAIVCFEALVLNFRSDYNQILKTMEYLWYVPDQQEDLPEPGRCVGSSTGNHSVLMIIFILPQTYIPDIWYHTVFQSKSRCSCTHEETHILDVEVKDFLHECGGHSDHHYVSPVLTKGPHHDHPNIPKRKYFSSKSPNMKQCKYVFNSSYLWTRCTSMYWIR